jgi:hypothetical protein
MKLKFSTISLFIILILTSCMSAVGSTSTETPFQPDTFTHVQASTLTPVLATGLPPQPTITPNPTQAKQQERIKSVIKEYFEIRYRALSVPRLADFQQNGFGDLVSNGADAKDFLVTEMAKLAVERKWYELNNLRYAKYAYFLKYKNIVMDTPAQTAVTSLLEYFEIICEQAMENNPENPQACAIGDLTHEIVLHDEQGQWKIVSDVYWDSWWRQFRKPGASTDEILDSINLEMQELEARASPVP